MDKVHTIWKRAQITAYPKHKVTLSSGKKYITLNEHDVIYASGHWDDTDGVYCCITNINQDGKQIVPQGEAMNVVLKPEDFRIFVMCEWEPSCVENS